MQRGSSRWKEDSLNLRLQDHPVSRTNATEENGGGVARIGIPELSEEAEKDKLNESELDDDGEESKEEGTAEDGEKEEEEEEDEEEYEGEDDDDEDEDEYEDELKTIAESHEAMSKDEAASRNASVAGSEHPAEGKLSSARKNFDSREKDDQEASDEDAASNEAFTDDIIEKAQVKVR